MSCQHLIFIMGALCVRWICWPGTIPSDRRPRQIPYHNRNGAPNLYFNTAWICTESIAGMAGVKSVERLDLRIIGFVACGPLVGRMDSTSSCAPFADLANLLSLVSCLFQLTDESISCGFDAVFLASKRTSFSASSDLFPYHF
ncbi:hypothetical protein BCR43DRAFT_283652 [Syncephalastrum racemosum]|uniref:Secreted protein n=1 Tax=Syncephalastrum racemosum TaxID=13706 RepID=A0A1X2HD02_SYNRA|nr:hypothetical protein BCR43DRAFT_283652 [Syncephalastrum racemosum]